MNDDVNLKKENEINNGYDTVIFRLIKDKKNIGVAEIRNHPKEKVSELSYIHIDDEYRKRGLSDRLMKESIKEIDSKGYVGKLELVTNESNVPKLKHIYKKYGFKECGSKICVTEKDKEELSCTIPYLREGKDYKKNSKEYQSEKEKWCNRKKKKR